MNACSKPFVGVSSEYIFLKIIENLNMEYILCDQLSELILNNIPTLTSGKTEITFADSPFQIKKYFESKRVIAGDI